MMYLSKKAHELFPNLKSPISLNKCLRQKAPFTTTQSAFLLMVINIAYSYGTATLEQYVTVKELILEKTDKAQKGEAK